MFVSLNTLPSGLWLTLSFIVGAHVSPRELSDPDNLLLLSYPFGSGSNASSRGTLRLVLFGKDTENIFSPFYKLFVPREQESWTAPKTAPICISLYIFKEWLVLWKELTSWLVKRNVCWLYRRCTRLSGLQSQGTNCWPLRLTPLIHVRCRVYRHTRRM